MHTLKNKAIFKQKAYSEISKIKPFWNESYIPIIADLGANIGYYTEVFLGHFKKSEVHSYEPHPNNIEHLKKIKSDRVFIHEYGLYNTTLKVNIGLPINEIGNNGMFSIHHLENNIEVQFKNANEELIRPHIVKIDVEGAEPEILECSDFFKKTKMILIEMLHMDSMNINDIISERLTSLGFTYRLNTTKNNQLWLK
jgi:FkbM family methyltransferase